MNPRRLTAVAALCGTLVIEGWVVVWLVGVGSVGIESTGAVPIEAHRTPSLTAFATADVELAAAPQATARGNVSIAEVHAAEAPVAVAPAADTPVAVASIANAPVAVASVANAPAVDAPVAVASVANAPAVDAPVAVASVANAPAVDAPVAVASVANALAVDAPVAVASVANAPAADTSAADAPVAVTPVANASVANTPVANTDVAPAAESVTATKAALDDPESVVEAALPDSPQPPPAETRSVQVASANTADPVRDDTGEAVSSIEMPTECLEADACIDRYLWALYQRTPKLDTIKELERRKVAVRKRGRTVTVTRSFAKLIDEDFAWKDPKAAEKAGMPMMDYVIGGMDRSFKLKLSHMLRAADEAGLSPGITSAFRDDYRQSIASGLKAATNRSYHGGSLRGGYGHGLAADTVSVKGATKAERWISTEVLWKWIDVHGPEFGIARPYLDMDPPHLAPIDGQEYADHHHGPKAQHAGRDTKKRNRLAARDEHGAAKRARTARSS